MERKSEFSYMIYIFAASYKKDPLQTNMEEYCKKIRKCMKKIFAGIFLTSSCTTDFWYPSVEPKLPTHSYSISYCQWNTKVHTKPFNEGSGLSNLQKSHGGLTPMGSYNTRIFLTPTSFHQTPSTPHRVGPGKNAMSYGEITNAESNSPAEWVLSCPGLLSKYLTSTVKWEVLLGSPACIQAYLISRLGFIALHLP